VFVQENVRVKLIPEEIIVDAYLPISSLDNLLIQHVDPAIIKRRGSRWEHRRKGSYEVIEDKK
jgi:hypothetical protein